MKTNRRSDARSQAALTAIREQYPAGARQAYRGYLCTFNALHNLWFVSRDACHIGSAQTMAECRTIIDTLA